MQRHLTLTFYIAVLSGCILPWTSWMVLHGWNRTKGKGYKISL